LALPGEFERPYARPMLSLANAPTSWGIENPGDPANPPWPQVLADIAGAGYAGTELGPLGFLPDDPSLLREALGARGLELVAGYVFEPLHSGDGVARAMSSARRTCELLQAGGGVLLVIIPGFTPEREASAGRRGASKPLDKAEWETMVRATEELARLASEEHGLIPVAHPHAGTHLEFADEIARFVADTDVPLCIDTGHCAYAGIDPVALYRTLAERVAYFHFKDVDPNRLDQALEKELSFEAAVGQGVFCPLGEGVVDFAALRDALEENRFAGWATVEQDRLPTASGTPAAEAAASLAHLRKVGLA
jgi:inosose dehydratase